MNDELTDDKLIRYDHERFNQAVSALDLSSWEEVGALLIGMGIVEVESKKYGMTPWYCCRCPVAQYFHKLGFPTAYATRSFAGIDINLDDDHEVELPTTAKEFIHIHDRISGRYSDSTIADPHSWTFLPTT